MLSPTPTERAIVQLQACNTLLCHCVAKMMLLSPATSLCLALLLLIPQTRSTTTGAPNTTAPYARAWCGDLSISYPFWLAGTHPPECGVHQAFQVTCDNATGYLKNSLWNYRVQAIFYGFKQIRAANADLLDGACNVDKLANASSVLKQFYVSSQMNQELFFLHGCKSASTAAASFLGARELRREWLLLRLAFWAVQARRRLDDTAGELQRVDGAGEGIRLYEGATGADYQRLMEGGFMLEYLTGSCER